VSLALEKIIEIEKRLSSIEEHIEKETDALRLVEGFRSEALKDIEQVLRRREEEVAEEIDEKKRKIVRETDEEIGKMKRSANENFERALTYILNLVLGKV
jgi:hypothetical protein